MRRDNSSPSNVKAVLSNLIVIIVIAYNKRLFLKFCFNIKH
ncbi:hypothetical protein HPHPA9_1794 [Helicobacter pylori Hp A-9]|uniref:Uncharacterized protein n=1 Tax=Helicobacter pylori Hp A-9 TaxID=992034 RepID=I9R6X4_HELPX|nr:hypothetical protein HPHPA9_1794 [Helicobacter pylori Hp A-9]